MFKQYTVSVEIPITSPAQLAVAEYLMEKINERERKFRERWVRFLVEWAPWNDEIQNTTD